MFGSREVIAALDAMLKNELTRSMGAGIPYGGLGGTGFGPVPTNAVPLAPSQITIGLSHRNERPLAR